MRTLATGLWLLAAFFALGLGPAMAMCRIAQLPGRFVGFLRGLRTSLLSYAVF